jgi:membrane-bound lytic murein transglycosylase MltF
MRVESFGDARAVSQKGAIGLMQVMPKTYAELRIRHRLERAVFGLNRGGIPESGTF